MKKSWTLISLTSVILLAVSISCSDGPKSLNPNGDSELALLMRAMYDDGMKNKQLLLDGKQPEVMVKYKQILTAKPTESMKVDAATFTPHALAYEMAMDSLIASDASNRVAAYQLMVNACMNCHQSMCPGPKVKIRHLSFSEAELASLASKQ